MRCTAIILIVLALATAVVGAGCGSGGASQTAGGATSASSTTIHFAKTKFALHAGLAFGAFHRYIYKPFKAGAFSGGLLRHKLVTLKAALAAVFAYHEVKLALQDARASKILSTVLSPLLALQTRLQTLGARLKHGQIDPGAINSANSAASQTGQAGARAGQPVTDQPTPVF